MSAAATASVAITVSTISRVAKGATTGHTDGEPAGIQHLPSGDLASERAWYSPDLIPGPAGPAI